MMNRPDHETRRSDHPPWWRGTRGEWWVLLQAFLITVIGLGPRNPPGWPAGPLYPSALWKTVGILLIFLGSILFLASLITFGKRITPLPYPPAEGGLIQTGPYRWVRHPIYASVLICAFGWASWVGGTLTVLYALALAIFFDLKSRREERWLLEKFPDYIDYQRRVKKLVPYIY